MFGYILQRVAQSALVLLVVGFVSFAMFRFVGDPIDNMLGQERTLEDIERLRAQLGLDDNFLVQYYRFLEQAVQGNFGLSYRQGREVSEILLERLPATLELAFVSGLLALIGGIALGIFTAIRKRGMASNIIMSVSLIGVSLPTFLIGVLLIYLFSVGVDLPFAIPVLWFETESWSSFGLIWIENTSLGLPSFGRGDVVEIGGWTTGFLTESGLKALILPAITLGLYQMTLIMRLVRTEMLEVLRMDYIRFARARGIRSRVINFRHALKNTLVPVITITGLQLGSIIAFAIITETVFQWPGVGLLFINAIQFVDIPVMAAYLMMISVMFVGINLIVDMLYFAIDPRLRVDRGGSN
ncbi:MAG: ABC transporter permease [Pseudomonadota bacterium]